MKTSDMSAAEAVRSWVDGRFVLRSGFYAGRPPSLGDLNSEILEMFYQGILRDVGQEEASNFVRFVNNLSDLSASAFIVAFEQFWVQGCTVVKIGQQSSDRNQLSGYGEALFAEGMGLLATTLGRTPMSEEGIISASFPIKQPFIGAHLKEIPEEERSMSRVSSRLYIYG